MEPGRTSLKSGMTQTKTDRKVRKGIWMIDTGQCKRKASKLAKGKPIKNYRVLGYQSIKRLSRLCRILYHSGLPNWTCYQHNDLNIRHQRALFVYAVFILIKDAKYVGSGQLFNDSSLWNGREPPVHAADEQADKSFAVICTHSATAAAREGIARRTLLPSLFLWPSPPRSPNP